MADETCACPAGHYRTTRGDGRCDQPPLRGDDPADESLRNYTWCGCCMADCPDVHANPTARLVGKPIIAEEYVAALPVDQRDQLRAQAAAGELSIKPRDEMRVADPDKIKILPSARRRHSWDETN